MMRLHQSVCLIAYCSALLPAKVFGYVLLFGVISLAIRQQVALNSFSPYNILETVLRFYVLAHGIRFIYLGSNVSIWDLRALYSVMERDNSTKLLEVRVFISIVRRYC